MYTHINKYILSGLLLVRCLGGLGAGGDGGGGGGAGATAYRIIIIIIIIMIMIITFTIMVKLTYHILYYKKQQLCYYIPYYN